MTDFETNRRIAKLLYPDAEDIPDIDDACNFDNRNAAQVIIKMAQEGFLVDFCNDWSAIGPLIEEYRVTLSPVNLTFGDGDIQWRAEQYTKEVNIFNPSPTRSAAMCLLRILESIKDI